MPLVIVCGLPASGKTRRTEQLKTWLESKQSSAPGGPQHEIVTVSDETLGLNRSLYGSSAQEKPARGALIAAVERALSPKVILILDSLNYIKGFRYQLFCAAKNLRTQSCVVSVMMMTGVWRHVYSNVYPFPFQTSSTVAVQWRRQDHGMKAGRKSTRVKCQYIYIEKGVPY